MAKKSFSITACVIGSIFALVVGAVVGFCGYSYLNFPNPQTDSDKYVSGDLQIHFIDFGNEYTGDCTYIKAGETDILIDAGSRPWEENVTTISTYLNQYVEDNTLEYVIVTHADQDHIACFSTNKQQSLFDIYKVGTLIDFPKSNKTTTVYENYKKERAEAVSRGTIHYTALQCWNETDGAQKVFELSSGIELEILYNYYYENNSSDENNYSVCAMINQGDKHFLFTGDLEHEGEEYLVEYNTLPKVELFKAGHHGSPTSSNDCLLDIIDPEICVVCCCAGSVEYSGDESTPELTYGSNDFKNFMKGTFPSQAFIDRISKHTEKVYVTTLVPVLYNSSKGEYENSDDVGSMNGNVVITSNKRGTEVQCSNNNTLLKDTEWFAKNRIMPPDWT